MVLDPVAATDWRQLAADTMISGGMFIGGERRVAIDGSTRPVHAARDGSRLVDLAWAQPADADAAVAAALRRKVAVFQQVEALVPDGIAGEETLVRLVATAPGANGPTLNGGRP